MFEGANLSLISDVDQDKLMFGSHEISLTYRCIIPSKCKSRYKKEMKQR